MLLKKAFTTEATEIERRGTEVTENFFEGNSVPCSYLTPNTQIAPPSGTSG